MFQRLLDLLFFFKEYVVLAACVIVSAVLLVLNDNPQVRHVRAVTTVVFGVVQEQLSFIPGYFGLRSENAMLRRVNIALADEAAQLREAKLENLRLRALVGMNTKPTCPLIPAEVVGKSLTLLRNTLTLGVGSEDGVRPFMPVINEAGLVGIVTAVSDHFAVVNLLINVDFRASVKIQRSRVDGIVAWDGVSLQLRNVTKTFDVQSGDVVITSEYSSSYPPDLRVGVVATVKDPAGSMFKEILIVPAVDFVKLEEVFVMVSTPRDERLALEQRSAAKGR